jgi:hypothetical protein
LDNGAPDDGRIGIFTDSGELIWSRNAEAHCNRQFGNAAQAPD